MASDNTVFMIVLAIIIILALYYLFNNRAIHNEGTLQSPLPIVNEQKQMNNLYPSVSSRSDEGSDSELASGSEYTYENSDSDSSTNSYTSDQNIDPRLRELDDSVDSSLEIIKERAMGQNGPYLRKKNGGRYTHDSYRSVGERNNLKNIDKHFKVPDISKNYTDRYVPMDESDTQNAPINIVNNKGNEKDKFEIDSYLPQEKEKDWFETVDAVDVKNSHLINIYRPMGVNTIGSSHKNSSYDLRGTDRAICPRFEAGPWMQSSTEPDRSMKSLC